MSTPDSDYKFEQIYVMGDSARTSRSASCTPRFDEKTNCGTTFHDNIFHQHNDMVALFTTALDHMPSDNHKIVIKADRTTTGQYARCFSAPTIDEIDSVVMGENLENRDIVIQCSHWDHILEDVVISYSFTISTLFDSLNFRVKNIY